MPLFAAAAGLIALAAAVYWPTIRQRPVAGGLLFLMRAALIAGLTFVLLGPSRMVTESRQSVRPLLSVLVDTSESMQTRDERGVSRMETLRDGWLTPERREILSRDFTLQIQGFDSAVRPLSVAALEWPAESVATGRTTLLADCVSDALGGLPPSKDGAALLVLSDGRESREASNQPVAALARQRDIPVSTVLIGRDSIVSDAAIVAVPLQEYLFPGESGGVLIQVHQTGLGAASGTLELTCDEKTQSFPIAFEGRPTVEIRAAIQHAEPGQYEYRARLLPMAGEATEANNASTLFCDVQQKRMRTLVLEGAPYWDTKFLAQALRKDERIELVQISQVSARKRETIVTRNDGDSPRLPQSADEWAKYDLVILGRGMETLFGEQSAEQLREWVNEGGHLIFARGPCLAADIDRSRPRWAALQKLEPVSWGAGELRDAKLQLAPAGRLSPWLASTRLGVDFERALAELPGFELMPALVREKPSAIVLATASPVGAPASAGRPAIVQMNVGRGSVVAIVGEGLWRWSLLRADAPELVGLYDAFWSNLARFLTMGGEFPPGQQVSLKLSRTTNRLGDPLLADVVLKQPPLTGSPELVLIDPSGARQILALERRPGRDPRFQAAISPKSVGVHRAVLRTPGLVPAEQEQRFSVYDFNEERLNTLVNPTPLRALAESSGGEFFEAGDFDAFRKRLTRHHQSLQAPPRSEYVWDSGVFMAALLVWAGIEWIARRNVGLL